MGISAELVEMASQRLSELRRIDRDIGKLNRGLKTDLDLRDGGVAVIIGSNDINLRRREDRLAVAALCRDLLMKERDEVAAWLADNGFEVPSKDREQ